MPKIELKEFEYDSETESNYDGNERLQFKS